jgi:hypothetical protein
LSEHFYTRLRGLVEGPFTVDELKNRARRQRFGRHYQVSTDRQTWSPAASFPELFPPAPERRRRRPTADPARGSDELEAVDLVEEPLAGDEGGGAVDAIPLQARPETGAAGWWYVRDDRECGPVSLAELRSFAAAGEIRPETLVWTEGWDQWGPAQQVPDLFATRIPEPVRTRPQEPAARERDLEWVDAGDAVDEPPPVAPMAVASLVLAVSVVGCVLAVVFGHVALGQIRQSERTRKPLGGRGMALAGLIMGYVTIGLLAVAAIVIAVVKLLNGGAGA